MSREMQTVSWLGISIDVPVEWELLQFSRMAKAGNLAWADRYEFRLELTWKEAASAPDLDRIMDDYKASLVEEDQPAPQPTSWGTWQGLVDVQPGGMSRYGHYEESVGRLLELVFLWEKERDMDLEYAVLNSVKPVDHWQAFGLEVRTPQFLEMTECTVQPANVQWTFSDSKKAKHSWHFERMGMLDAWLNVPLDAWLLGKEPVDLIDRQPQEAQIAGHDLATVTGFVPALKFPQFSKRSGRFIGAAWVCPVDNRLYYASMIVPRDYEATPQLFGGSLRCCPACTSHSLAAS